MPTLKNSKQEAYCQAYVKGEHAGNATACYAEIYGKDPSATGTRASASKLNRKDYICKRVAELQLQEANVEQQAFAKAVDTLELDKQWILERLMAIVERCMQAEPVLDPEGKPTGEFRFDGKSANRALELLGKHLGLFVERRLVTVEHADKSDDELRRTASAIVDQLARLGVDIPSIAGIGLGDERATTPPRPN